MTVDSRGGQGSAGSPAKPPAQTRCRGPRLPGASPGQFWASPKMEMGSLFQGLATSTVETFSLHEARIHCVPTSLLPLLQYPNSSHCRLFCTTYKTNHFTELYWRTQWHGTIYSIGIMKQSPSHLTQHYRNEEESKRLPTRGKTPELVATATGSPGYGFDEGTGTVGLWDSTDRAQGSTCPCAHMGEHCCSEQSTRNHSSSWMAVFRPSLYWTTSRSHKLKSHN